MKRGLIVMLMNIYEDPHILLKICYYATQQLLMMIFLCLNLDIMTFCYIFAQKLN